MAKYSPARRTARAEANRVSVIGGTLLLCKGTVPSTAEVPDAANVISRHSLSGTAGSVTSGVWTIPQAQIAADTSADNAANTADDPSYIVFLNASGGAELMYPDSEVNVTATPATGDSKIEAGRQVNVISIAITEGGA